MKNTFITESKVGGKCSSPQGSSHHHKTITNASASRLPSAWKYGSISDSPVSIKTLIKILLVKRFALQRPNKTFLKEKDQKRQVISISALHQFFTCVYSQYIFTIPQRFPLPKPFHLFRSKVKRKLRSTIPGSSVPIKRYSWWKDLLSNVPTRHSLRKMTMERQYH